MDLLEFTDKDGNIVGINPGAVLWIQPYHNGAPEDEPETILVFGPDSFFKVLGTYEETKDKLESF